jgi:hypothetical protein
MVVPCNGRLGWLGIDRFGPRVSYGVAMSGTSRCLGSFESGLREGREVQ